MPPVTAEELLALDAAAPRHRWEVSPPDTLMHKGCRVYFPSIQVEPGEPPDGRITINKGTRRRGQGHDLEAYDALAAYIAAAVNEAPALAREVLRLRIELEQAQARSREYAAALLRSEASK